MPGKSRRKLSQTKKRKHRRDPPAITAQQQTMAQTYKPVSQPEVPPSTSVPAPIATLTVTRYPYIAFELRRIGILAGIILAILIVLALVLS